MPRSIHVRLDAESEAALSVIRSGDGLSDSAAVRLALNEAASRRRSRTAISALAQEIGADEADRAEVHAIRMEMDHFAPADE